MKRLAAVLVVALAGAVLVQSLAQGAPAAKKTATIPVPEDGNATVAHLVLKATAKKGKKPKKPVKRPKLKVLKAPKGVVVAASFKRDAKNKNRWHATVAITNPAGSPAARSAASIAEDAILMTVIETDDAYIIVFEEVEIEDDVTYVQMPIPPWMAMNCDPPGSSGYGNLFGSPPPGVSPPEFVNYLCTLGMDGPTAFEDFGALGLAGVVFDLDPFPGNPLEYYVRFEFFNVTGVNGVAFQFPGHTVTAQLPPTGFAGVITPQTATWGNKNQPYLPATMYRGNVRFNNTLTSDEVLRSLYTMTGGQPYSEPYPGHYTP